MNHPYLYPDECPWLQEHHDFMAILRGRPLRPLPDDDDQPIDHSDDFNDSDLCDTIELGYRRS